MSYPHSRWRRLLASTMLVVAVSATPAFAATPGVDPSTVEHLLAPGEEITLTKTVTTPVIAPKPDLYFLADTTGSMGSVIGNVKANASDILAAIDAAATDPRYGAGDYKDFPFDPYAFHNGASVPAGDDNGTAALAAISAWSAGGGADGPEANLYALHKLITEASFRTDSTKIVVWFGDAPGHDPVCGALTGEGDVTEASVTAELVAAGVKVIAVSTTTGYPAGLDDDPKFGAFDYSTCGAPGGSPGQASRIAAATGGAFFADVPPGEVSAKILEGLTNLPVDVTPVASCDSGLSAGFSPPSTTVTSGDAATFTETLKVAEDATGGVKVCTVDFLLNGNPGGPDFVETNTITVNTPPDCSKVTGSPASLWPPNHKFRTITLSGASDPDGDPTTLVIDSVTQDEALDGEADGNTSPDAAHVAGRTDQVQVRGERSGIGDGRVYRIGFSVSDGTASCMGTAFVGVPHDQSGQPAVDTTAVVVNSFGP